MQYIAFDARRSYTLARVEGTDGRLVTERRIAHARRALEEFLTGCEPGCPVAVETIGSWYWIVDEVERAGMVPQWCMHTKRS